MFRSLFRFWFQLAEQREKQTAEGVAEYNYHYEQHRIWRENTSVEQIKHIGNRVLESAEDKCRYAENNAD